MTMRRLTPYLLYLGMLLFMVLFGVTMISVRDDWNTRVEGARSLALYDMVKNVVPNRPTDTPGVTAWLHLELQQYFSEKFNFDQSDEAFFVDWQDYNLMPSIFEPLSQLLIVPPMEDIEVLNELSISAADLEQTDMESTYFRSQSLLHFGADMFVNTTRKGTVTGQIDDFQIPSHRFLHASIPVLSAIKRKLHEHPHWLKPGNPFRAVRLYTLCENDMLTTLPLGISGSDATTLENLVSREVRELSTLPKLPNFVSNEFFFIFNFQERDSIQPFFSGLYLDIGGHGLVATLMAPLHTPEGELKGVLGLDISFDLDWADFAQNVKSPLVAELVAMPTPASQLGRHPWQALLATGQRKHPALQEALTQLARNEQRERRFHNPSPIYHGHVPDQGAAVTFRVNPQNWLVVLFPQSQSQFPTLSLTFLSILFLMLLAGFEWNRRQAQRASRDAVREFEEKQNLLDTMRVPLMVVDPNTEEIVYGNRASQALGIEPGKSFKSLLERDPEAKAHYERMQVAGGEARRAYGLPVQVAGKSEYAIIRSVAVRAPIGMIRANERHRLGILFLIDPEADLALFTQKLTDRTRSEERSKLASLLDHGIDTLARVHVYSQKKGENPEFLIWLSDYIHRRIRLTSWVLHHWNDEPPLPPDCLISARHGRGTIARWNLIFAIVASDADLRLQLHWHNGVLADMLDLDSQENAEPNAAKILETRIQWPENVCFTCPVAGGFGFFLAEILINAIRHGDPGQRPCLRIKYNHGRRELMFRVSNRTQHNTSDHQKAYGGLAILKRLADLFGWRSLQLQHDCDEFSVSWRVPASENDPALEID